MRTHAHTYRGCAHSGVRIGGGRFFRPRHLDEVPCRQEDGPLRFVKAADDWPAGTKEAADLLESLGVGPEVGYRPAGKVLSDAGHGRRQTVIRAAQKWRRQAIEEARI